MTFQPGQSGNPGGRQKDKPFQTALRMEEALAAQGVECEARPGSLRYIARRLLDRAGDDNAAARDVADRLDGKPAQVIIENEGGEAINERELLLQFSRLLEELGISGARLSMQSGRHAKSRKSLPSGED